MKLEEKIPITIAGQSYEILGNPSDALYYNSLAQYVENKMKEIMGGSNIVSSQKIAVLAALNIADELFREQSNKSNSGKSFEKKHEDLIRLLDQILQSPAQKESHPPPEELLLEPSLSTKGV